MRTVFKSFLVLAVAGVVALVGFAVFSDLPAPEREVTLPIQAQ